MKRKLLLQSLEIKKNFVNFTTYKIYPQITSIKFDAVIQ